MKQNPLPSLYLGTSGREVDGCVVGVPVTVPLLLVLCLSYELALGVPLLVVPQHRNFVPSVYYHICGIQQYTGRH